MGILGMRCGGGGSGGRVSDDGAGDYVETELTCGLMVVRFTPRWGETGPGGLVNGRRVHDAR